MWQREKSEIKSHTFQQWETQSCESLPHYFFTWMVKTRMKCPTDNVPVSGVLRVKALLLLSRLFITLTFITTLVPLCLRFPGLICVGNYRSGLSFHCISDSNYQTEVKGRKRGNLRKEGKSGDVSGDRSMLPVQNMVLNRLSSEKA